MTWVTVLVSSAAASVAHAAEVEPEQAAARAEATAISDAYAHGWAKPFRHGATEQIEGLAWRERDELAAALRGYVDIALERGAQGLEGVLSATAAALAARDYDGWRSADAELTRLTEGYWVDAELDHPNAAVPVARPGSPVLHYLPLPVARALVEGQMRTGTLDIEGALGESICDPSTTEDLVAHFGARMAALLERLCAGGDGGAALGGMSLGFGSDLSIIDCLMGAQETRAERVGAMMQACAESMLESGPGNPLTSSGAVVATTGNEELKPIDDSSPYYSTFGRVIEDTETYEAVKAEAAAKARAESQFISGDDKESAETFLDEDGDMVWADGYENGARTESVELRSDNSYVVRKYDENDNVIDEQEYGPDGKPVGGSASSDAPGMDFGATPECRALTVALIGERAASAAVEAGAVDPRTQYPRPDAPDAEASDLDCLDLAAGPTLDAGFGCNEEVAMCPPNMAVSAGCGCKASGPTLSPERQCGMFMRCADGAPGVQEDGTCSCTDTEQIFYDAGAGPRPRPEPFTRGPNSDPEL